MNGKLIIAGPCSAENESQVLDTAAGLSPVRPDFFRAGLWKPRSRSGCFEGVGSEAVPWMLRVRDELGLRICTEVALPSHVEVCMDSGFDMLWLGARTVANPFLVQEVASALEGVDIPVMVKNPVSADTGLWIGAVERLQNAGVKKLGLVHRGFSTFGKTRYRNEPCWGVVLEMKNRFPSLPLVCDPSHIGGARELVPEISQTAMDMGLDGLMVECHPDPDNALSDSSQQMSPQDFILMLAGLRLRHDNTGDSEVNETLRQLRTRINEIDEKILSVLSERMAVSRAIGRYKSENGISIIQPSRWGDVLSGALEKGSQMGLGEDFVSKIFNTIHEASVTEQNKKQQ